MPMKNPAHPGALVGDDIEALGLTVAEAAKGLGVTRQQLYNVINGKSAVSAEMAVRLEMGMGGGADFWLRMQASYDLAQIRLRKEKMKIKRLAPRHSFAAE
jgi:addiction module HigA family antidote